MKTLNLILHWIVLSSEDSSKISKSILGFGSLVISFLVFAHVNTSGMPELLQAFITFVDWALKAISAAVTVWGMFRKVSSTLGGTNAVLNDRQLNS